MKQFRTVKRRAKVGECILITNKYDWEHRYKNGSVGEVFGVDVLSVFVQFAGVNAGVDHCEYEVIIDEVNPKEENEMNIENIADQQLMAVVTTVGAVYSTYGDFARASGYPEAIHPNKLRENNVVKLLAKGKHERENRILYVVETEDGTKQIIGENGLRILATKQLTEYSYEELLDAIKAKAQAEVKPKLPWREVSDGLLARVNSHRTPQQQRDDIIEKAKRDVAELEKSATSGNFLNDCPALKGIGHVNVKFVVNHNKRTVVALLFMRYVPVRKAKLKGIAKCAPTDCFNVHIGRAIALRRALGLEVPSGYLNAPQPTEVRVGDVIRGKYAGEGEGTYDLTIKSIGTSKYSYAEGGFDYINDAELTIIDDSREGE
ncbi:hypothetical protein M1D49_07860 [Bacillus sp. PK3-056]|uniref:hypothetical protein n=1 Tax=Niallia circulans TaxID=1397 RepID=UPI000F44CFBE|nr:hypothetical protein [Niallia circulans]AYV74272.1 hypothetical protein C2H98_23435 [Niallia circulans]